MENEKRLNVYVPEDIFKELKEMDGSLKSNVCTIFKNYLHNDSQDLHKNVQDLHINWQYNVDL
ncbi:MAG: hypothetical protein MUO82_02425 [Candidatus Thermoplasmatota archaeon]|nr:hypothetical protein [Candidatus Thermoplasmatota archaeon]